MLLKFPNKGQLLTLTLPYLLTHLKMILTWIEVFSAIYGQVLTFVGVLYMLMDMSSNILHVTELSVL